MAVFYGFGYIHLEDAEASFSGALARRGWYLDLICKRDYSNSIYLAGAFSTNASSVDVFILSTGIISGSIELAGRSHNLSSTVDTVGRGTELASVVGGKKYGVAKEAQIFSIAIDYKDLRSSVSSAISTVLAVSIPSRKQVVLLDFLEMPTDENYHTLTSLSNDPLAKSVQRLLDRNITTVACAKGDYFESGERVGNFNLDFASPVRNTNVITVGGFDETLSYYEFCNYGSCVSVNAPCTNIIVECIDKVVRYKSSGDYAAALVAGVCALILSKNKNWGHKEVKAFLKRTSRKKKINIDYVFSYDGAMNTERFMMMDTENVAQNYLYPYFDEVETSALNAYYIKNTLELLSPLYLGEYDCEQTFSYALDIVCKTFYDEARPFLLKIVKTDCSFIKITPKDRKLYGFIPKHRATKVYEVWININNGVNSLTRKLTFSVKKSEAAHKHILMNLGKSEKEWLDINLTSDPKLLNLRVRSFKRNTLTRPVSRQVVAYDHVLGTYSNQGVSSPDTGHIAITTNSDVVYAMILEDKNDAIKSNSQVISRLDSE